jgi:myo-inositol 2-dehydrogenase/D-chiro-inositol 1-dehydrogenase
MLWRHRFDSLDAVIYEYANGVKLFAQCRQQVGCANDISVQVLGARGTAAISSRGLEITAENKWTYDGVKNNSFLTEHNELFASIRTGKPINNGNYMAKSTLMAIMGRMATYTGQVITWE